MKIVLGEGPSDYINDSVCKTEKRFWVDLYLYLHQYITDLQCFLGIHNVNPS